MLDPAITERKAQNLLTIERTNERSFVFPAGLFFLICGSAAGRAPVLYFS
jgi:hypothetical protein